MRLSALLPAAALLLGAAAVPAQQVPQRPLLPFGADTNNAQVYYQYAIERLRDDPQLAADALCWTTRLDPTFAEGFYARRIALLLTDPCRLLRYWDGVRSVVQSAEVKRIDSLYYQALTINPFVSQGRRRRRVLGLPCTVVQRRQASRARRGASRGTASAMTIGRCARAIAGQPVMRSVVSGRAFQK